MSGNTIGCPHHGADALREQGLTDYSSMLTDMDAYGPSYEGSTEYGQAGMDPKRVVCVAPAAASRAVCGFVVAEWDSEGFWSVKAGATW